MYIYMSLKDHIYVYGLKGGAFKKQAEAQAAADADARASTLKISKKQQRSITVGGAGGERAWPGSSAPRCHAFF
jgi:hypothetical protein